MRQRLPTSGIPNRPQVWAGSLQQIDDSKYPGSECGRPPPLPASDPCRKVAVELDDVAEAPSARRPDLGPSLVARRRLSGHPLPHRRHHGRGPVRLASCRCGLEAQCVCVCVRASSMPRMRRKRRVRGSCVRVGHAAVRRPQGHRQGGQQAAHGCRAFGAHGVGPFGGGLESGGGRRDGDSEAKAEAQATAERVRLLLETHEASHVSAGSAGVGWRVAFGPFVAAETGSGPGGGPRVFEAFIMLGPFRVGVSHVCWKHPSFEYARVLQSLISEVGRGPNRSAVCGMALGED